MNDQTIRSEMLLGSEAIQALSDKHVAVFGIGGVGGFCAEALARAGVGHLTLVDDDTVSVSNLNRQLVALHSTVGLPKTEVLAQRILDINPNCCVTVMTMRYVPEHREQFLSPALDYISDCIDSVSCKTDLIASSIGKGIPIISAMGTGNKLDPTKFTITDLAKTSGCPLARVMRRELKQLGITHHTVLYSTELPTKPLFQPEEGSRVPGSVSWVPGCAGLMMAGYIIRELIRLDT